MLKLHWNSSKKKAEEKKMEIMSPKDIENYDIYKNKKLFQQKR